MPDSLQFVAALVRTNRSEPVTNQSLSDITDVNGFGAMLREANPQFVAPTVRLH